MDRAADVERLFSWLNAPKVHYREFAPQVETAEAVATWPAAHRAAVQSGVTASGEPPLGGAAARERLARDRRTLSTAAAEAVQEDLPPGTVELPTAPLGASLGQRLRAARAERDAADRAQPFVRSEAPRHHVSDEPPITGFEEGERSDRPMPARPTSGAASERGALFGGEYQSREDEAAPPRPAAPRQGRSLDAVFSRLAGERERLPDPRDRARTLPGRGGVFGRAR